jgi:hypothetical protein
MKTQKTVVMKNLLSQCCGAHSHCKGWGIAKDGEGHMADTIDDGEAGDEAMGMVMVVMMIVVMLVMMVIVVTVMMIMVMVIVEMVLMMVL